MRLLPRMSGVEAHVGIGRKNARLTVLGFRLADRDRVSAETFIVFSGESIMLIVLPRRLRRWHSLHNSPLACYAHARPHIVKRNCVGSYEDLVWGAGLIRPRFADLMSTRCPRT
jgi:hypothetical protein